MVMVHRVAPLRAPSPPPSLFSNTFSSIATRAHHCKNCRSACLFSFAISLIIFADCCIDQLNVPSDRNDSDGGDSDGDGDGDGDDAAVDTNGDDVDDDDSGISSTAIGGRERPGRQTTRRDNQPNERGATRGGGMMRGGGKAKAPDNVTRRDVTTNEWRGVKRGGGAG